MFSTLNSNALRERQEKIAMDKNRVGGSAMSHPPKLSSSTDAVLRLDARGAPSARKISVLKLLLLIALATPLVAVAACRQEGPAERAGTSIDNAGQKIKDAVDPPGPAQKTGRALDKTTE
jgi:hypothetical protein